MHDVGGHGPGAELCLEFEPGLAYIPENGSCASWLAPCGAGQTFDRALASLLGESIVGGRPVRFAGEVHE